MVRQYAVTADRRSQVADPNLTLDQAAAVTQLPGRVFDELGRLAHALLLMALALRLIWSLAGMTASGRLVCRDTCGMSR